MFVTAVNVRQAAGEQQPHFLHEQRALNMSVQRGSTAYLHCRVADLQDQSVRLPFFSLSFFLSFFFLPFFLSLSRFSTFSLPSLHSTTVLSVTLSIAVLSISVMKSFVYQILLIRIVFGWLNKCCIAE